MTPLAFSESQLCDLLLLKDRGAFSYLYDLYNGALFGEIIRLVKLQQVAEDILQETFVQVYRQFNLYDPTKERLFTWLITIARNKSIDFLHSASMKYLTGTPSLHEELIVADENATGIVVLQNSRG